MKIKNMKKEILKLMLGGLVYFLSTYSLKAQVQIKLIGFTNNGETIDNFVKWNAGETGFQESYPVNYIGVLSGSSVYNSNIGEYYSRVLMYRKNNSKKKKENNLASLVK